MNVKKVDQVFQTLVDTEIVPGISVLAGQKQRILFKNHYGLKARIPQPEIITENTIYDLASLTKPLITGLLTVYLIEKEKISLDTPIKRILPSFPFDFTLLHLLTHSSGLPPWFPFYLFGQDYSKSFSLLSLEYKTGKRVNYSCTGYIVLRYIIETISGKPFTALADEIILKPLNLKKTFFHVPSSLHQQTAPTENGNLFEHQMVENWLDKKNNSIYRSNAEKFPWRQYLIQGETHDINSYFAGGTAGNAGLFSTTEDIFKLAFEFLPSSASLLKTHSLELFRTNFTPFTRNHRSIGFKLNSSLPSSGGHAFSPQAFGHTGFTGTSLWIDPVDETIIVILSNRIHPRFKAYNFDKVRRKLHRVLFKCMKENING